MKNIDRISDKCYNASERNEGMTDIRYISTKEAAEALKQIEEENDMEKTGTLLQEIAERKLPQLMQLECKKTVKDREDWELRREEIKKIL